MKLAIIGSGMIVGDFLSFAHKIDAIKLQYIVGTKRSEEKLKNLVKEYKINNYTVDYEEVLKSTEVDTVYVALPNYLHYEYAKKALLNGKNVICEKPFTLNSKDLEELIEIANSKKLILLEAITNQYQKNYDYIKENIKKLGDIKIVSLNYSQYSSRYDAFKKGELAPVFDVTKGGGALLDLNIYNIHVVVGLFGLPTEINYFSNVEKEVDTSGILTMKYNDKVAVCIAAKDCSAPIISTIQGDKGSIVITGATNEIPNIKLELNDGFSENINLNEQEHRMFSEFIKFVEIIETKDYKFANKMLEHSLNVMKVIDKARGFYEK